MNFDKLKLDDGIELTDQFKEVLDLMENTYHNLFITGNAGTGKSSLLKTWRNNTKKEYIVLAPTGIAAVNVQGQTIHSAFRFPLDILFSHTIKTIRANEIFRKVDTIVIDEISMVRADIFDAMDLYLRINGPDSTKPFGGVQLILFGDPYQLPPVVTGDDAEIFGKIYSSPYFFASKAFYETRINYIQLTHIFRQKDPQFISILNRIRNNTMEKSDFDVINKLYEPFEERPEGQNYITLTTINRIANEINQNALYKIDSPEFVYKATVKGMFKKESFPVDEELRLRVGAQVMFVRNDSDKRWVNGTLGKVVYLDQYRIDVEVKEWDCTRVYTVPKETWESTKYDKDTVTNKIVTRKMGSYTQYPLKIAYGITIHKSQGSTFDNVDLHFGNGAFVSGQTYVAFSRCRTLEGIKLLKKIEPTDILLDKEIVEFMKNFNSNNLDKSGLLL